MKPKLEKLDWQINLLSGNLINVSVNCVDFDQSMRFVELLKTFILKEREQISDVLPDLVWHCPPENSH